MGFWQLIGSAVGAVQGNRNIDKQLKAQSTENALNRQYNLELAKMQNSWNIQQWKAENAYNSPAAQMERMRQAGLNPDMMYGGGVSGNLAASSPQMTSGAPSSPMDWTALGSKATIGDTIDRVLQQELTRANIDKIKSETKGQDIDNSIQDFQREIVDTMRDLGYQGVFADARASLEEYSARLKEWEYKTQYEKYQAVKEDLRHNKVMNEFEESLNEQRRKQFNALVQHAVDTADIIGFVNKTKELDFWTDKGIAAIQTVVGSIGALKNFKVPDVHTLTTVEKGEYGSTTYTHKWSK